jgi:hypothetical protein
VQPVNRRTFLKQAGATASAAGLAAALPGRVVSTAAPSVASSSGAARPETPLTKEEASQASFIVAQLRDAGTGEIALFVGERELTIHDRNIAARLVRASR